MSEMNGTKPAGEPVVDLSAMMKDFKPAPGVISYASMISVLRTGNDYMLVLHRPRHGSTPGAFIAPFTIVENCEPVAISVKTLKDLHRTIGEQLALYEQTFGKVETDFTRRMDEAAARSVAPQQ